MENAQYWKTARWMSEGSEIRERLTCSVTRDNDMHKHGGVSTHHGYNCSLDILWTCSVSTTNNYFHADGVSGLCQSIYSLIISYLVQKSHNFNETAI